MRLTSAHSTFMEAGFTLVEMLVVLALITLISIVALPTVTNYFKLSLNSTTREMASLVKEAYNSTVMTGRVHRMVYDLKAQAFWVEAGPNTILLDTAETKEKEERRKRFARDSDKPPPSEFSVDKSVSRSKVSLPQGVTFEDVMTEASPDPVVQGLAYTHFFAHGVTEQTVIHLKDSQDHHTTLVISPLIGHTRVIDRYVDLKEAYEGL